MNEPTVTRHHHPDPESLVYVRVTLGVVCSVGLAGCAVTCRPHCSISPSIFAALETPSPFPSPTLSALILLLSPWFYLLQNVRWLES